MLSRFIEIKPKTPGVNLHFKTKDFENAKSKLQAIVNEKSWNANRAEALLKEL